MSTITGVDVLLGIVGLCVLFIGVLWLMSIKNEQEKKINSLQDENSEQKIQALVASESADDTLKFLEGTDTPSKPKE